MKTTSMHQPVECLPTHKEALQLLEELSERHNGSVCLRRYSKSTIVYDTRLDERRFGEPVNHNKVESPTWVVYARNRRLLGTGRTPEEAIQNAVQADFRKTVIEATKKQGGRS